MKKTGYEHNFIMGIYRMRHRSNDIVILVPIILAIVFPFIVAPILIALFDIPLAWSVAMVVVPLPLAAGLLYIRKMFIVRSFIKEKDVSGRVEIRDICCNDLNGLQKWQDENVLMFSYSELMVKVLYNWLKDLCVTGEEAVIMYKIEYTFQGLYYLGIRERDLNITDENRERYKYESGNCISLSDMSGGKIVDTKLVSRITRE